jgi:hypothetical protein
MAAPFRRTAVARGRTLAVVSLVLTLGIFVLDRQAPVGSAIGMLYVGVVLLGLWSPWPAFPLVAAYGAAVLVLADLHASWDAQIPLGIIVNYPLMILVLLITAVVVRRFVALERQAEVHLEQLGDFKRALDAAAIVATTDVKGRIT